MVKCCQNVGQIWPQQHPHRPELAEEGGLASRSMAWAARRAAIGAGAGGWTDAAGAGGWTTCASAPPIMGGAGAQAEAPPNTAPTQPLAERPEACTSRPVCVARHASPLRPFLLSPAALRGAANSRMVFRDGSVQKSCTWSFGEGLYKSRPSDQETRKPRLTHMRSAPS